MNVRRAVAELAYEDTLEVLQRLGLRTVEARFYLLLRSRGPLRASELARSAGVHRVWAYRLLEGMQSQGIVEILAQRPRRYLAAPLESFAELRLEERKRRLETDEVLLRLLLADPGGSALPRAPRFQIFRRSTPAFTRGILLVERSRRLIQAGFDREGWKRFRSVRGVRVLIRAAQAGREIKLLLSRDPEIEREVRALEAKDLPRFEVRVARVPVFLGIASDHAEALVLFPHSTETPSGVVGAWSNDPGFVDSQGVLFRSAWEAAEPLHAWADPG